MMTLSQNGSLHHHQPNADKTSSTTSPIDTFVLVPFDSYSSASFVLGICLACLATIGTIGSAVTCYIFTRPEMRQTSINFLLTGLSVFDGSVALFGGMVFATVALCAPFPESATCNSAVAYSTILVYPLAMMAQTASIWTLIIITIERFIAVCFPLHAKLYCTIKRAKVALISTSVVSFGFNVVRYFEYELYYNEEFGVQAVRPILKENDHYLTYYMLWLNLITHYIVPTAALVSINSYIIYLLKRSGATKATVIAERRESCITLNNERKTSQTLRRFSNQSNSYESRTTWMMLTVIALFLLCNTSSFVLNALEAFKHVESSARLFWVLSDFNNLLVVLNSSLNFFIYYKFSVKYRRHCINLVKCGYLSDNQLAMYGDLLSSIRIVTRNVGILAGYEPERMGSVSPGRERGLSIRRESSLMHCSISRNDS